MNTRWIAAGIAMLLGATCVRAQTVSDLIRNYIAAMTGVTNILTRMTDPDSAQRNAPDLIPAINTLNPLTAQVKALYGVSANQTILQNNAAAISDAQTKLGREQSRLLTGDCSLEGTVKSLNSNTPLNLVFTNRGSSPLQVFWLDYSGNRYRFGTMDPGASFYLNTFATHPWLFADQSGNCQRIIVSTASGSIDVSPILAPTVGWYLAKIAK
jgi:hypothetical protein